MFKEAMIPPSSAPSASGRDTPTAENADILTKENTALEQPSFMAKKISSQKPVGSQKNHSSTQKADVASFFDDLLESKNEWDFFSCFDLTPCFDLDDTQLENSFLEKQRTLHPDQFIGDVDTQDKAEKAFSNLVHAYETLKNPLNRAKILFKNHKLWPLPQDPVVLEELLEWEENLRENPSLRPLLEQKKTDSFQALSHAFKQQNLKEAATFFMRWRALERLLSADEKAAPALQQAFTPFEET